MRVIKSTILNLKLIHILAKNNTDSYNYIRKAGFSFSLSFPVYFSLGQDFKYANIFF